MKLVNFVIIVARLMEVDKLRSIIPIDYLDHC